MVGSNLKKSSIQVNAQSLEVLSEEGQQSKKSGDGMNQNASEKRYKLTNADITSGMISLDSQDGDGSSSRHGSPILL